MTTQNPFNGFRLHDIVAIDHTGQRMHEPIAVVAAPSREAALTTFWRNPHAYLLHNYPGDCRQIGQVVPGCEVTAYETNPSKKSYATGPFTLYVSTLQEEEAPIVFDSLADALQRYQADMQAQLTPSDAFQQQRALPHAFGVVRCVQGYTVYI